jgi:hypothetical protein
MRSFVAIALAGTLALGCGSGGGGGGGDGTLEEAGSEQESASSSLWLSSGGRFFIEGAGGRTLQGELPPDDRWRVAYAVSNPTDTDGGVHPQNVFRLIARSLHRDARSEASFIVRRTNLSASPNRSQSNGVLLFLRFRDGEHAYYGGVRVDGNAVIKKEVNEQNFTLALNPVFPGAWSRDGNPNLIPANQEIDLAAEIEDRPGGTVAIRIFVDGVLAAEAVDDGVSFGGAVLPEGLSGIRGDFMDLELPSFAFRDLG